MIGQMTAVFVHETFVRVPVECRQLDLPGATVQNAIEIPAAASEGPAELPKAGLRQKIPQNAPVARIRCVEVRVAGNHDGMPRGVRLEVPGELLVQRWVLGVQHRFDLFQAKPEKEEPPYEVTGSGALPGGGAGG
jgi:hypothetical protein